MGTRRRNATDTAADADASAVDELILSDEPTIEQQLDEFFGEAHDGVTCSIYELGGPRHDQRGFLFSFPFVRGYSSAELYGDLLQSHGPGWYELSAQREGGGGWVKRKQFQLGSERDRMRAAMRKAEPGADRTEQPVARSGLSPELAALIEGQNRILERLIDRPERDTMSMARELAELKGLFATPERRETPIGEIMKLARDFLELKNELSGDGGDDNPLASALRQFAPAINAAVERLGHGEQPGAAPAIAAQPRPGTTRPGDEQPNGHAGGAPGLMDINALFADLNRRAQANEPPAAVANAVLVFLAGRPEWVEAAVLSMVMDERERIVNRIVGSYPELGGNRPWLHEVVQELLKLIESDEADEDDPPRGSVNGEPKEPTQPTGAEVGAGSS